MRDQVIVSIGREHGSGGHCIGKMIADQLRIQLYDREIVEHITRRSGYAQEIVDRMDEKPRVFFISRRIGEYSNSLEENVAEKTFEFLREKAGGGESFVIVGRCAETVLSENANLYRVFIRGDWAERVQRIMEVEQVPEARAKELIREVDRRRKAYHNYYCDNKWGDGRGYDIVVNSSKLGLEKTAELLTRSIRMFME